MSESVQAQRLGDRIRDLKGIIDGISSGAGGLKKFIDFMGGIDFSKLGEVIAAFRAIGAAVDLKGQVLATLAALKLAATLTATTTDDTLIATLDKIVGNESLLDLILGWVKAEATTAHTSGLN